MVKDTEACYQVKRLICEWERPAPVTARLNIGHRHATDVALGECIGRFKDGYMIDTRRDWLEFIAVGTAETERMIKDCKWWDIPESVQDIKGMIAILRAVSVYGNQLCVAFLLIVIPGLQLIRSKIVSVKFSAGKVEREILAVVHGKFFNPCQLDGAC